MRTLAFATFLVWRSRFGVYGLALAVFDAIECIPKDIVNEVSNRTQTPPQNKLGLLDVCYESPLPYKCVLVSGARIELTYIHAREFKFF